MRTASTMAQMKPATPGTMSGQLPNTTNAVCAMPRPNSPEWGFFAPATMAPTPGTGITCNTMQTMRHVGDNTNRGWNTDDQRTLGT